MGIKKIIFEAGDFWLGGITRQINMLLKQKSITTRG